MTSLSLKTRFLHSGRVKINSVLCFCRSQERNTTEHKPICFFLKINCITQNSWRKGIRTCLPWKHSPQWDDHSWCSSTAPSFLHLLLFLCPKNKQKRWNSHDWHISFLLLTQYTSAAILHMQHTWKIKAIADTLQAKPLFPSMQRQSFPRKKCI